MKVLFSWLKEFVDVPGTAADVAARLSVRGFAVEGIDGSGDDAVVDFEVTGNRPDCMAVLGLAREVATAFELPLREPARLPVRAGAGARGGHRLRPAVARAGRRHRACDADSGRLCS